MNKPLFFLIFFISLFLIGYASADTIIPGGIISTNTTWSLAGSPFIVTGIVTVQGASSPILTIEPGVEVRFNANTRLNIGTSNPGALLAQGTAANPILFTSNQITKTPGFWDGITFNNFALDTSLMDYCTVEYGGRVGYNVYLNNESSTLKHSMIRQSSQDGVRIISSSSKIEFNNITQNNTGIRLNTIVFGLSIRNNNIYSNTTVDLDNDDTNDAVIARLNYWGQTTNPSNRVLGLATVRPWLGSPFTEPFNAQQAIVSPLEFIPIDNYTEFLAKLSEIGNWTIDVRDTLGTVVKTFSGAGDALSQRWFGDDQNGLALPNGTYTLILNATSQSTAQALSSVIDEVTLTGTLPIAQITSPIHLQFLAAGTIPIQGTAAGTNFQSYTLDYGVGESPVSFITIVANVTTPVTNGILGNWNATTLTKPVYTVRLRVFDPSGTMIGIDTVTVNLLNVYSVSDSVDPFSPDNDGVKETTTFNATFTHPVNWTLTLKNPSNITVKTFAGSGTSASQLWDGKDETGIVVPDGIYTYVFSGTEPGSGVTIQSASLTSTVDVTDPTVLITSPTENEVILSDNDVNFNGTADDVNFLRYTLAYGAGITPPSFTTFKTGTIRVVGGVLGTLNGQLLVNGTYTIRLTVEDRAGNQTSIDRVILLDRILITNLSANPDVFDPVQGETGIIHYTLNLPADVTLQIYADQGRQLVRTLFVNAPRPAGPHTENWDGRNDSSVVLPREAYYFVMTATDTSGRSGHFNNATNPLMGPVPASSNHDVDPDSAFDPYRNTLVTIRYEFSANGRIPIHIRNAAAQILRNLVDNEVRPSGTNTEYWDGRKNDGTFFVGDFNVYYGVPSNIPQHALIIRRIPMIDATSFKTEAYLILPLYREMSTLTYTLNREARVTVEIQDPNGNHFRTLTQDTLQSVGSYSFEWDGEDDTGSLASVEGSYRTIVTAVDTASGESEQRTGTILIYR